MRLRLLLVVGCLGALVSGGQVLACPAPDPAEPTTTPARSVSALALLEKAAQVSRNTSWTGTQSVLSTRGDLPSYQLLRVSHVPGAGTTVEGVADGSRSVAPDLLDEDLFGLLTRHYDLAVLGSTTLSNRRALLVEVRRPGRTGPAAIAGRFWIDGATRMVLRRDVMDDDGVMTLSSAFSDLRFTTATPPMTLSSEQALTARHLTDDDVEALVEQGWPIVDHLPDGLERFEALRHQDGVVQLSYSDGLSTLSLFVQEGSLPQNTAGTVRVIGGAHVRQTSSAPEQLVWAGAGRTWTLVSDAPDSTIEDAVLVLPHADPPVAEGMGEKLWRGMSRVGSWLNPFA